MVDLEGSENVDEKGMTAILSQNENRIDQTLGEATRVYSSCPDFTGPISISDSLAANYGDGFGHKEESLGLCGSGFSNARFDSPKKSNNLEISADKIEERSAGKKNLVIGNNASTDGNKGDVLQPIEYNPNANKEVSQNCISLFVEVFGPPNGFEKGDEHVSMGNLEREKSSNYDEVEMPNSDASQNEVKVILSDEDKFLLGDVVWIRTTTNTWWPGQIIDPAYVTNVASKPNQKAFFLVKYIGKYPTVWSSPIWCSSRELKPFVENFEHMSLLKKYRGFPSAVKEAVDELGRRIKAQMTCYCDNRAIKERYYIFDRNVVTQFEPVNFLYLVKNIAWNESTMGVLELVKIRSHLSAFYRSLGRHQLPMNQLHEKTDEDKHSAEFESKKVFERDRKRILYLSYPPIAATLSGQSSIYPPKVKSTAKKLHTKRPRKSTYQPQPSITIGDLGTSLVNLLSMLRFSASDYALPSEKKEFDLVGRFFDGFRRWAFHDKCVTEVDHKYENREKSKDEFKPLTSDPYKVITSRRKRRKKGEMSTTTNGKSAPTSGIFNVNGTSGSFIINFEVPGSLGPENMVEPKRKRGAKKCLERMHGDREVVLPANNFTTAANKQVSVKNKKNVGPSSGYFEAETHSIFAGANANYAKNGSVVKNLLVNAVGLTNREKINCELMSGRLNDDGKKLNGSSLVKDAWLMGFLGPANNIPEAKERLEKTPTVNGNANFVETNCQAQSLPDIRVPIETKPRRKRKRRNTVSGPRSDLDPCFSKVLMNEESLGTAIVLTFAQGFPVPSKEDLIATFGVFGSLNETETKGLSDNISAQVVFNKGSDALEALKGVEKSCPFGPFLVKCRLHHLSTVPRPILLKPCELKATDSPKKEAPDLAYIRKNLEMMTSVLEKGGDNLSVEMREKLENGVKSLLKKVNTMVGSTSSS